jgi:malonyl-CoA/methylmalonyl-CoA synthetase
LLQIIIKARGAVCDIRNGTSEKVVSMNQIELIKIVSGYGDKTAITDNKGSYTYEDLVKSSQSVASNLLHGESDLGEKRVAFLIPSGFEYVAIMLGIWRAGGIAVPLCVSHPDPELGYVLEDSGAEVMIASPEFGSRLGNLARQRNARFLELEVALHPNQGDMPPVSEECRAMIIYTSGTTSRPKGVVSAHANIRAQITSLVKAWGWSQNDFILNVLPLHHLHGILNALLCALWSGARCELMRGFQARRVWEKFVEDDYTLFMAVPTIYSRLIRLWDEFGSEQKKITRMACRKMRLMVSGSAALPVNTLERWREISGHTLLERYGMTEIGMALSNPLDGKRIPGHVGAPLPGIDVRLINEGGSVIVGEGAGEIIVKGKNVFLEYWNKPEATSQAFINGDWFKTGDIAERNGEGVYRILGRNSVDIFKSGGYKISALEIEEVLRGHPDIEECAVVGVEDEEWGERVCAALVMTGDKETSLETLREWCRVRLAPYKIPSRILWVKELPRNQMGKVTKPDVVQLFKN